MRGACTVVDPIFEIELNVAIRGARDASRTLHRQLKTAIAEGRLPPGAKLPGTRRSDSYFGVSRNTVVEVYHRLLTEGSVVTRRGSGTYVAEQPRANVPPVAKTNGHVPPYRLNDFWLRPDVAAAMDYWGSGASDAVSRCEHPEIDLRPAIVDAGLFPFDVLRRVSVKALRSLEKKPARRQSPHGNQGHFPLRAAIVRHIALTRAIAAEAEDILVTSGAQQAFDLLARVLVTPGQTVVAVEDPGYPPMRIPFAAAGARVVPVGVDAEGLLVEQLPADARVICLCPAHQFPLGVTLSPRRRSALLAFAQRHGAVIIEDDYDSEFRYDGPPAEALRNSVASEQVFYIGTFSKCMLPALRLGFVIAPPWAIRSLVAARNCQDWHSATPLQMAVARFISEGHLARHVRKMRQVYRERRAFLLQSVTEQLGRWLTPSGSFYGLHLAAVAHTQVDLQAVTAALQRSNVKVHDLSRYFLGKPTRTGVVLGYGVADLAELEQGIVALRQAFLRADS